MAISSDFLDYVQDQFSVVGQVAIRRMFGGAGLYFEGVMFGLIVEERIYLKADKLTQKQFEDHGMGPFVYEGKGKPISMSYFQVPEEILDDQDQLQEWAMIAIQVARSAKLNTKARSK